LAKGKLIDTGWQKEAKVDQVVKVGVELFKELGDRTTRLEGELGTYRQAMIDLAKNKGVEVPSFVTAESGGLGEAGSADQLHEWLEGVLAAQSTAKPEGSVGRGRGRGASGVRKKGGRSKSTRDRGKSRAEAMDEGE